MFGPSLIGIFWCSVQSCQGRRLTSSVLYNFVRLVFHCLQGWLLWVGIHRSLTFLKIFGCKLCLRGLRISKSLRGGSCYHESYQKSALSPFLTSQKACFWKPCIKIYSWNNKLWFEIYHIQQFTSSWIHRLRLGRKCRRQKENFRDVFQLGLRYDILGQQETEVCCT